MNSCVYIPGHHEHSRVRTPLHLNESDIDSGLGIFGMGLARNQIKSTIVRLYAFNHTSFSFLVRNDCLYCNALYLRVGNHMCNSRIVSIRVWQNPSAAQLLDVADRALAFLFQFSPPSL